MKGKIFKTITAILILMALTMTNFIYVGVGLVSYAESNVATNNQNVEFGAQINNGKLNLELSVKKDGYFNGTIELSDSNFKLKSSNSEYINQVEDNKITLNQINAGTTAKMEIEIEPVQKDVFNAGLLNMTSKLQLSGIYKNSSDKENTVKATREVAYKYTANSSQENVKNSAQIITNKIVKISGEEKRVVEISMNMGLKDNSYPIKNMEAKVSIPQIDSKSPKIVKKVNFNTMTHYDYQYDGKEATITFTNEPNENNLILWRKTGSENVVLTLIYDKDAKVEGNNIKIEQKLKLYDAENEIATTNTVKIDNQEKNEIIKVTTSNTDEALYKGKLNAKLDKQIETKTAVAVNFRGVADYLNIVEQPEALKSETETNQINAVYNKTTISKEAFDKILGENGTITITNQNGEVVGVVNSSTPIDENKNIVIDYTGKEPESIRIRTTKPIAEGDLEFTHQKTIKSANINEQIVKNAKTIETKAQYEYGENTAKETSAETTLEESKTEVALEVNKETLSTTVENNVEIRAKIKANSEKYNLLKNPTITVELPEDVESAKINSIDLIYETELKVKNYNVNGRILTIELEGEQTSYKESGIEGTIVVINTNIAINKKAATKNSEIKLNCANNNENATDAKTIKIVAPKSMTVINNIKDLNVETSGQEETKQVTVKSSESAKQYQTEIEIVNNNENQIENVKLLGTFATNNDKNNMNASIVEPITLSNMANAKIYYTENANATEDLKNTSNGWEETIEDASKVKKYLITITKMESQESIKGTYKTEIPENLEYNQTAKQGYSVKYTNTLTKTKSEIKATTIEIRTGIGPKVETKLEMQVAGSTQEQNAAVKNGEVIKYKLQVSNVGSTDLEEITVKGNVPEGTTLVQPADNYEYTGTSYYKELPNKEYEQTIQNLKAGKVATLEYEVRVNNDTQEGTKLTNKIETKYGDETKTSNETNLVVSKGNLRITVKRVTDRSVDLYETGTVNYYAIVENISDKKQSNVKVKTNISEGLTVSRVELITGMTAEEITDKDLYEMGSIPEAQMLEEAEQTANGNEKSEEVEYKDEINIGDLQAGEAKVLSYNMTIGNKVNSVNFSATAKSGNEEYKSNNITNDVKTANVTLEMTSNTESQYVKAGDQIEYTIKVKNNGKEALEGIKVKDTIPASLTVEKVTFDDQEIAELRNENNIEISCDISGNSESTIKITTVVNYSESRDEAEAITNVAYAELLNEKIATTTEINHIITANNTDNGNNNGNNSSDNTVDNNDIATGNKTISGMAWYDENSDGKKDDGEKTLSGIKVQLLNTQTNNLVKDKNGNVLEATTNENGLFILNNIGNGKYIAVFDYDQSKYSLTKYKAENVDESKNSNVLMKEIEIENNKQQKASTDIIEVGNENISNINIGLTQLQDFDLKLDKYVSKIVVQNSAGTTVKEYNDETVAKAEIDGKKVSGTTVIIEYKIRVTNAGQVPGYVRKIADYMPNDLKFSSELNKDWYQTGDTLYNASLANDKIAAGELKEVTLTLTKSMTENNTGRTNNTAEIAEAYNDLGLSDINSTPANKKQGENDMGSADTILSIKTGGAIYATIIAAVATVLAGVAFIIIKIKNKKENI